MSQHPILDEGSRYSDSSGSRSRECVMQRSVKVAALVAFALGSGNLSAVAQQGSVNNPGQAQTDPTGKPAGDTDYQLVGALWGESASPGQLHP